MKKLIIAAVSVSLLILASSGTVASQSIDKARKLKSEKNASLFNIVTAISPWTYPPLIIGKANRDEQLKSPSSSGLPNSKPVGKGALKKPAKKDE